MNRFDLPVQWITVREAARRLGIPRATAIYNAKRNAKRLGLREHTTFSKESGRAVRVWAIAARRLGPDLRRETERLLSPRGRRENVITEHGFSLAILAKCTSSYPGNVKRKLVAAGVPLITVAASSFAGPRTVEGIRWSDYDRAIEVLRAPRRPARKDQENADASAG